jgi:hypothetical protein
MQTGAVRHAVPLLSAPVARRLRHTVLVKRTRTLAGEGTTGGDVCLTDVDDATQVGPAARPQPSVGFRPWYPGGAPGKKMGCSFIALYAR